MAFLINVNQEIAKADAVNSSLMDKFINYLDCTPKTIETYKRNLKQFFNYLLINGIDKPVRSDVLSYKEQLKATGHKPATIQGYITAVKLFFSWTEQEGYYPNIAEHIKGAKLDKGHKKDYLAPAQVEEILNAIDQTTTQGLRDYAIIILMVECGLRTIEIERANVGDLKTTGTGTILFVQGKGHEEKNDFVKVPARVEKAIRNYLKTRNNIKNETPLFVSLSNNSLNNRLSTRTLRGMIKERFKQSGYDSERLTAHSLRHTAVTLSLMADKDITEVREFARHSNINTTMIYNHALEKSKNSCSEAIDNLIFRGA